MAAVETPTEALGLRNRKRNSQNDLSDDGSNKKTRKNPTVSEPVTPLGATPVQKRVNNLNKSTVLTPSTGSNAVKTPAVNTQSTRSAKAANQPPKPKNQGKMTMKKIKEELKEQ